MSLVGNWLCCMFLQWLYHSGFLTLQLSPTLKPYSQRTRMRRITAATQVRQFDQVSCPHIISEEKLQGSYIGEFERYKFVDLWCHTTSVAQLLESLVIHNVKYFDSFHRCSEVNYDWESAHCVLL